MHQIPIRFFPTTGLEPSTIHCIRLEFNSYDQIRIIKEFEQVDLTRLGKMFPQGVSTMKYYNFPTVRHDEKSTDAFTIYFSSLSEFKSYLVGRFENMSN